MRIFAFYTELEDGETTNPKENRDLIEIWKKAWLNVGFEPIIIGMNDIQPNPKFKSLANKAASFPCVCGHGYQDACMVRFAISHLLNQGEWVVAADYDVFPRHSFRDNISEILASTVTEAIGIGGDMDKGPGFFLGNARTWDTWVDRFTAYEKESEDSWEGRPNVSEMLIMRKRSEGMIYRDWVRCYGREGWRTVPICHFGNAMLNHRGVIPKWKEIQQILEADK